MSRNYRKAVFIPLVLLALRNGGSVASASEPPREMADLVRSTKPDLEALYLASPPAPLPCGFLPGRAIKSPGSWFTMVNSRMTRIMWQGKIFHEDRTMINRVFGGVKALPADVYYGESLVDGKPSLILDYSQSKLWPNVRDEIREVSPGFISGSCSTVNRLRNRKCTSRSMPGSESRSILNSMVRQPANRGCYESSCDSADGQRRTTQLLMRHSLTGEAS